VQEVSATMLAFGTIILWLDELAIPQNAKTDNIDVRTS
jgi:hypothetical protein